MSSSSSVRDSRADDHVEGRSAKTSAAAVFGLVFGVSALICVLAVVLSPVALVLGLIGLVVSIVGIKMAGRTGVTGKGVAIGGLVLSVLSLLLVAVLAVGLTFFLNDQSAVDRLEQQVNDLKGQLPDQVDVPTAN